MHEHQQMISSPTASHIREYWDARAADHRTSAAATTDDVHLRELEVRTLIRAIRALKPKANERVLDVGCGDGRTTLRIAEAFDRLHFTGVDFSPAMIENALGQVEFSADLKTRVQFKVGDATLLDRAGIRGLFDIVLTSRCLINLPSAAMQRAATAQIARLLRPGGRYIAIENFHEGHEGMNRARASVGLDEIPIRWHNLYFRELDFGDMVAANFDEVAISDFSSSYYFATRVIYSKLCQMRGEKPDYNHDIHRLSIDLPEFGCFSPIRIAVLRKK